MPKLWWRYVSLGGKPYFLEVELADERYARKDRRFVRLKLNPGSVRLVDVCNLYVEGVQPAMELVY